jgi:hypothetical protein
MTPKEFFEQLQSTDANCPIDKNAHKYSRFDLFKFAKAYHEKMIKTKKRETMCKEYEIKTMQDIINCVTIDKIDSFMIDFRNYLESAITIKKLGEAICEADNINRELARVTTEGFTWIDDGEHNCTVELKVNPKN